MGTARAKLIAGNWKMNGTREHARQFADALMAELDRAPAPAELLVCPPATLLALLAERFEGKAIALGGQDCDTRKEGAHTGDIAAAQLADAGARFVILGHSERRQDHGETSEQVRAKAEAARAAGLVPLICVGETQEERAQGATLGIVETQLRASLPRAIPSDGDGDLVVAYEPVWAIGSGATPSIAEIAEVHRHLHGLLASLGGIGVRVLYGGSVKPGNAKEILGIDGVDGALVGGASLKAEDFLAIARACG